MPLFVAQYREGVMAKKVQILFEKGRRSRDSWSRNAIIRERRSLAPKRAHE